MLSEALDFPTSGERGSGALLVGSALLLLSVVLAVVGVALPAAFVAVLLPQLAIRGYYVRVLRATAVERDPVAPAFDDVRDLFREGLAAVAIGLVYFLPTLMLFAIGVGGNVASAVENPLRLTDPISVAAAETVGSLAALLGLFSALAALYLVPGAVTLYAHEGRVRSALDLRSVVRGTFSEDYAVGWVLSLVLQVVLVPVAVLLYPLLVGVLLQFFLGVVVRYVWGTSFGAAMKYEPPTVDGEGITPDSGLAADRGDDVTDPSSASPSAGRGSSGEPSDDATPGSPNRRSTAPESDPMADESNR